jgi:PAS domain S-box-containing protein
MLDVMGPQPPSPLNSQQCGFFLRGIIESSTDLVAAVDTSLRVVVANRAFRTELRDLYGSDLSPGVSLADVAYDPAQPLLEVWRRALAGDEFVVFQPFIEPSGRRRYYEMTCGAVRDDTGTIVGAVQVVRDLSDRMRAENELRSSEEELAEVQRITKMGSYQFHVGSGRLTWSRELYRVWALDPFEPPPAPFPNVQRDDQARVETAWNAAVTEGKSFQVEFRIQRPDGQVSVCLAHGRTVRKGGDVVRIHGTVQDITERKRVEGELRDSRERLNLALEAADEGIWDWDVPSGLTYFSPRYYALLGYGLNDFEASYASWRRMVHPDDVARVVDIDRRLSPSTPDYKIDLRMRAKGGDWRWMTVRGKAVAWDPEGRPVRVVGTHTDIVDRKRAEAEREQLIAELEAKNTEMQRFSYAVSHDLKSPLITIRGFLGFLREDVAKNDLGQFEKDITRGIQSGRDDVPAARSPPRAVEDWTFDASVRGRVPARGGQRGCGAGDGTIEATWGYGDDWFRASGGAWGQGAAPGSVSEPDRQRGEVHGEPARATHRGGQRASWREQRTFRSRQRDGD